MAQTLFTDETWAIWEPLIEAVRPRSKTSPHDLRRTIAAIFWRHENGAKWGSIPAELGPWCQAAQLFHRLGETGYVGTPARTGSGPTGSGTRYDFSGLHKHQDSPQSGGSSKKDFFRRARPS
ncbi:transposase [Komagataeibacter medellinensis]|uniref:transposase n=1 Tax=Komagataeibacter medellinensis TaxID=1177712 RepID=UPI0038B3907F